MIRKKLADPRLELARADGADLETEITQRATQVILDVECFGLQQLSAGQ